MKLINFLSDAKYKNNKSGITGLHQDKKDNCWYCQIQNNGVRKRKCFRDKEKAIKWLEEQKSSEYSRK